MRISYLNIPERQTFVRPRQNQSGSLVVESQHGIRKWIQLTSNEQKQATTMAMDATKGATVRIFWFGFGRPET